MSLFQNTLAKNKWFQKYWNKDEEEKEKKRKEAMIERRRKLLNEYDSRCFYKKELAEYREMLVRKLTGTTGAYPILNHLFQAAEEENQEEFNFYLRNFQSVLEDISTPPVFKLQEVQTYHSDEQIFSMKKEEVEDIREDIIRMRKEWEECSDIEQMFLILKNLSNREEAAEEECLSAWLSDARMQIEQEKKNVGADLIEALYEEYPYFYSKTDRNNG